MMTKVRAFALIAVWFAGWLPGLSQETTAEEKGAPKPSSWKDCPTRTIKPRMPPEGWKQFSDAEHGVSWFSPSEVKKTVRPGAPPTVVYDAHDGEIGISVYCVQTNTRFQGSPTLFLDSMDEAAIGSLKRHGINGIPKPIANVNYGHTIGRILRIDVPGSKTIMKCDLTTPTECYTVAVTGLPDEKLNAVFAKCVTSLRFTPAKEK
jgi:hypothetical protein